MDARKAIDRIHAVMHCGGETTLKARDLAIMALEKQIAKKPIKTNFAPKCPNCGVSFLFGFLEAKCKYCENCGQAIDWK